MKELMNWIQEEESGQGLVEYALIVGLIALVCIVAIKGTGTNIKGFWNNLESETDSL